ncbi:Glycosyltransferase involved in cell wall bisynthesis [Granulicella rosea]|uniref:Glycosyltransferase involved in cell wall bisynthesis n=1 Tax=Granulicella rosea TaxID=474952 RepID=A0A239ETL3_9BACT|nr:glycosyltransferase family 4 protein [Granulicella rosea]SNS47967.1 Glycosyltransferase involved in cell wall bisynthesis [Granulicella rosea]
MTSRAVPHRDDRATVRMAYLLSRYPAISHTFFLHEVLGLRARGLHIETASINQPDRSRDQLPAIEAAEADTTFYIKGGSKSTALIDIVKTAIAQPSVVWRGLRAVFGIADLTLRQRGFWLFYLAEAILAGRWMKQRGLNHLHVHFGGPVASVALLTSAAWRIPYSITIHGPEELLNMDAYQLREKTRRASFVVCISDFCRSQLFQITPMEEWHKFHVVRLGVDPMLLTPPDNATSSRTLELVCTGRLVAAKGHQILLEALLMLQGQGAKIHATLIGAGPERESLERFALDHGLGKSVTFTSSLSHQATLDHVRRADIFTLASFAEGIPVAIMEAMSLGVPCVSTTIAGIPELIRSGIDGLLVPPANASALADALRALVDDPGLRRKLGVAARERIISHYNLPLNQELLARVFERQAAGRSLTETHSTNSARTAQ